ncbi:MAG TPA: S1 RNA-binding domain-containing protein [Candidatus Nanoarchaeia archaeon]|nr:S1 RNA-binding domain-containing protein [Candidatus Nanoarchaeia archaeon]
MFYKQEGYPEEDEIVLCKVTKIFPNSVFVELLEYGKPGMVHISEVSPGRIRNLRDFVAIDRQIVCKILRMDREKGHIDLSLRRVNSNQRREKLDEIKSELKAESLISNLAKKINKKPEVLYAEITKVVFKEYSHLYLCFKDIVSGDIDLAELGLKNDLAEEVKAAVIEKFKPKKISVQGEIRLKTYHSDGVEKIRDILKRVGEVSDTISISYLGAGRYKLSITDLDYKPAENTLKKVEAILTEFRDKLSEAIFEREKE